MAEVKTCQVPRALREGFWVKKNMPAWGMIDSSLKRKAEAVLFAWSQQNTTICGAKGPHVHCQLEILNGLGARVQADRPDLSFSHDMNSPG